MLKAWVSSLDCKRGRTLTRSRAEPLRGLSPLPTSLLPTQADFDFPQARTWRRVSVGNISASSPTRPPSRLSLNASASDSELHSFLLPKRTTSLGATTGSPNTLPCTPPPSILLPVVPLSGSTIRTLTLQRRPSSLSSSLHSPIRSLPYDQSSSTSTTSPSRLSWQPKPLILTPRTTTSPSAAASHLSWRSASPAQPTGHPSSPFSTAGTSPRYGDERRSVSPSNRPLSPTYAMAKVSQLSPRRRSIGYLPVRSGEDSASASSGMWDEQERKMRESPDSSTIEWEEEREVMSASEEREWRKRTSSPLELVREEGRRPSDKSMWDASDEGSEGPRAPLKTRRIVEEDESATDEEEKFESSEERQDEPGTTQRLESGTPTRRRPPPPIQIFNATLLPSTASSLPFQLPSMHFPSSATLALPPPSPPPSFPLPTLPSSNKSSFFDYQPLVGTAHEERQDDRSYDDYWAQQGESPHGTRAARPGAPAFRSAAISDKGTTLVVRDGGTKAQAYRTTIPQPDFTSAKPLPLPPRTIAIPPPSLPLQGIDAAFTHPLERPPPFNTMHHRGSRTNSLSSLAKSTGSNRSLSNTFSASSIKALMISHRSERSFDIPNTPWPPGDDGETKVLSASPSLAPLGLPGMSNDHGGRRSPGPNAGLRWEPRDPRAMVDGADSAMRSLLDSSPPRPAPHPSTRSSQQSGSIYSQSTNASQRAKATGLSLLSKLKKNSSQSSSKASIMSMMSSPRVGTVFPGKPFERSGSSTSTFEHVHDIEEIEEPVSAPERKTPPRLLPRPPRRPTRQADRFQPKPSPTQLVYRQHSSDKVVLAPASPTTIAVASFLFVGPPSSPSPSPSSLRTANFIPSPTTPRRPSRTDVFDSNVTQRDPTPSPQLLPRPPRIDGTPPVVWPPSIFPTRKKKSSSHVNEERNSSRALPTDVCLTQGRPRSVFPTRKKKKEPKVLVRNGVGVSSR